MMTNVETCTGWRGRQHGKITYRKHDRARRLINHMEVGVSYPIVLKYD